MLPPERLHSTMNQKSARTLLTTDVPQCVSKQGRLSAGGGGGGGGGSPVPRS